MLDDNLLDRVSPGYLYMGRSAKEEGAIYFITYISVYSAGNLCLRIFRNLLGPFG